MSLKQYIILFLMFSSVVFFVLFASPPVFAGEWANPGQTCTQYCASTGRSCITTYDTGGTGQTVGGSCSSSFTQSCSYVYPDQICCGCQGAPRAPTPTPRQSSCNINGAGLCCRDPNPIACSQGNWCCPSGSACATSTNTPVCCPAAFPQYCGNVNRCIGAFFDCSTFTTCPSGSFVCPAGYRINCGPPVTCRSTATPTPTRAPTPTSAPKFVNFGIVFNSYSISGNIFTDTNGDLKKNPSESNYTGAISISVTNGFANFAVSNVGGVYTINILPPGQYTVTFSSLPQDFVFTYPSTPLIVRVGPGCFVPVTSEAACSGNSIINLNAGVTNRADAWFQSTGSDMRWDSGFSNTIPQNKYASIPGTGGMPGIIFSGASTPVFGSGQASQDPFNWIVGSFAHPEVFTDTHNLIPTSYRFLLETVDGSGIAKKTVTDLCSNGDSSNCALNPVLANGVYKIDGNLNLSGPGYTFPASKDFIILINGNLNINEKIHVPIGSTAIFSAKGNITVNRGIGETVSSATPPTIEGLYSADGNFVADGNKNCPTVDLRLNVAGSVVANAGRTGGTFVNNRDMCAGNSNFPSVTFIERPDFMLNYPNLVQQVPRSWREAAP